MSDHIPQEVLIDVFTRLPVETLVRCTSVCNSWYTLITSPSFISQHLNRTIVNDDQIHLLVRYCSDNPSQEHYSLRCDGNGTFDEYVKFNSPFTCLNSYFMVIGSCNGLICISDDQFGYNHTMFLWNPSIRKSVAVPNPNITFDSHGPFMHSLGFGFDSFTNDFKVVRIVHLGLNCNEVPPKVELYTLKTGYWQDISAKALPYLVPERSQQAYVNGVAHWVASTPWGMASFRHLIVSFDMNNEVLREMLLPDSVALVDDWMQRMSLVVFKESLSLIQHCQIWNDPHCSIWMMKEYGVAESWSKQFRIDLRGELKKPVGLRRNGEVLLAASGGYLVSYDPESKRVMNLGVRCTINSHYGHSFYVDTYTESLVLLDKGPNFCDTLISDLFCVKKKKTKSMNLI